MRFRENESHQESLSPPKAYLARRVADGKTKREAFRALKRYLVRAIWRLWHACLSPAGVEPAYHAT